MAKTISIDNAIIDTEKFRGYNSQAQQILDQIATLQEEFKDLIADVAEETKIKKAEVSGYFKARHKAKIKATVKKGELFEALTSALDD